MGDFNFIEIAVIAALAIFLLTRLRSVLGRHTDEERERGEMMARHVRAAQEEGKVVPLPQRGEIPAVGASGMAQVKVADPSFDETRFLQGAEVAFGMIVEAYAKGDIDTLRPLLADDLYEAFAGAIRQREEQGQTLETRIEDIDSVIIDEAWLEGSTAYMTVRFVSRQVNVTRDASGAVIDGLPEGEEEEARPMVDLWTFARNLRSKDPTWLLVATRAEEPNNEGGAGEDASDGQVTGARRD